MCETESRNLIESHRNVLVITCFITCRMKRKRIGGHGIVPRLKVLPPVVSTAAAENIDSKKKIQNWCNKWRQDHKRRPKRGGPMIAMPQQDVCQCGEAAEDGDKGNDVTPVNDDSGGQHATSCAG